MPVQDSRDEALIRRAFVQFALVSAGLITVVVVGVLLIAGFLTHRSATAEAQTRGEVVAAVVETGLKSADGGPPLEAEVADAVAQAADQAGVRAVVVWDASGTVLWSTHMSLIGQSFELEPELSDLFGSTQPLTADRGERLTSARPAGLLSDDVAVFSPITDAQGTPLLVEAHVTAGSLDGLGSTPMVLLLPLGVAVLAVFEGLALMVGARLARRVQASRGERIKLMTASLGAVENERRRLAHDLHDGIIQDLAATRYALMSVMQTVPPDLPEDPRSRLSRVCELLGEELDVLRGMLGEMVPPEAPGATRSQMIQALVARLVPEGIAWSVEVDGGLATVDPDTLQMVHRVVQEGVRNAVRHARPSTITVRVTTPGGVGDTRVRVEVEDDGVGPAAGGDTAEMHYGLRLLRDLVHDLDGDQQLLSLPEGGARLVAEWPVSSARTASPAREPSTTG